MSNLTCDYIIAVSTFAGWAMTFFLALKVFARRTSEEIARLIRFRFDEIFPRCKRDTKEDK